MILQSNRAPIRSHQLYQPYFIGLSAAIIFISALMGALVYSGYQIIIMAAVSFVFTILTSIPIFTVWQLAEHKEKTLFFGSYIAWGLLASIVWIGLNYYSLIIYSYLMAHCCDSSSFLQVEVWEALTQIYEQFTPIIFIVLFLYISAWLSINIQNSKNLSICAKGLTILSFVWFVFIFVINVK